MDIIGILEKLQSDGLIRLNKVVGKYYSIYCPFHNNGNERKPSCGVLLEDEIKNGVVYKAGWTHCFTCGYAKTLPEMISDLLKEHSISKSGIDWLKDNVPDFDVTDINNDDRLLSKDTVVGLNNLYAINYIKSFTNIDTTPNYVTEEELVSYRYTVPYMYERKLNDELIEKFDVGFDANWVAPGRKKATPCITFPVRDINGNTLFIVRRSIEGKFFSMPKDIEKPVYGLYELPKNCKSVILVESCFNALTCYRYGKPALALLGTGTPYQINQLKQLGIQEFILGFDPDEAGQKATNRLKRGLKQNAIIWEFKGIPLNKDINDLTEEEFNNLTIE